MSNKNSHIVSENVGETLYGRFTYTDRRDPGTLNVSVETSTNNTTTFVVERDGVTMRLNGNEARTIFSTLLKHYYC